MGEPTFLNLTRAAAYLNVSRRTLLRLMRGGQVPYVTLGGSRRLLRIDIDDLKATVDRFKCAATPGPFPPRSETRGES